jgi:uncharacterized membrane protein
MRKSEKIALAIILISFAVGIYFYPLLPDKIASHWGIGGQADNYSSKTVGLFIFPIIAAVMFLVFLLIPRIDPLKSNIEKFRKYFDNFVILLFLFLFYIYLLTIFWNLGLKFNMGRFLIPALSALFYFVGVLTEKSQRNWFIGIRTPWTISSDAVWDKTNKLGGKLFKIIAIISLIGIIFPVLGFFLVIIPVIVFSIFLLIYSYFEYKKELKK